MSAPSAPVIELRGVHVAHVVRTGRLFRPDRVHALRGVDVDLFEGELTDDDKLVYVNNVIKGKLMESEVLAEQARNNTKAQFAASPNFDAELMDAIIAAFEAHQVMSRQALDSEKVRAGIKSILLGPAGLYEGLRAG